MRELFFLFPVFITLLSCSNSNNSVKVVNESDIKIDSILLIGNQKCKPFIIKNLLPNNSITGILENCNEPGGDGAYIVKIYTKKNEIIKGFGYYTNGVMYFDEIVIKFTKNDDILIEEKY
jgi:hypothetical protein